MLQDHREGHTTFTTFYTCLQALVFRKRTRRLVRSKVKRCTLFNKYEYSQDINEYGVVEINTLTSSSKPAWLIGSTNMFMLKEVRSAQFTTATDTEFWKSIKTVYLRIAKSDITFQWHVDLNIAWRNSGYPRRPTNYKVYNKVKYHIEIVFNICSLRGRKAFVIDQNEIRLQETEINRSSLFEGCINRDGVFAFEIGVKLSCTCIKA